MNTDQIAIQLYTLREHTQRDMLGTLQRVGDMGYRAVELAGYGNATAQDIRTTLDARGMQALGAHVPLNSLLDQPEQMLADLQTLGCQYAVIPAVPAERRSTPEAAQHVAADLDRCGALCQAAGLRLCYHNHAWEFAPLGDTTLWDVLTTSTDPALVAFELDVFWVQAGGHNPVALIQQMSGRVPLLHLKDMTPDEPPTDAPVGDGTLPWAQIMAAGAAAGARWYIVEQDHPRDPLRDVQRSLDNIRQMR